MKSIVDIRDLLGYDPETGLFTRKVQRGKHKEGEIAGCLNAKGYVEIKACGKIYEAHRLAHLFMTGSWPSEQIDHVNHIKSDNRWSNLREASRAQNTQN